VTQIELSATDARSIGISAPLRESGDVAGSGACKIIGPAGEIEITEGVMVAKRHIHATPAEAEKLGIKDSEIVSVKIDTDGRSLIFGDVVARVNESYALAMHIDTDESNAAGCVREQYGEIIK
jgi:putative phosphotransacetylase